MKRVSLFQSSPSYLTVFFFLLLFVFIAFGSALNNEFLSWDDDSFVSANRMIQSFDSERLFQMATSFHWQLVSDHLVFTRFRLQVVRLQSGRASSDKYFVAWCKHFFGVCSFSAPVIFG